MTDEVAAAVAKLRERADWLRRNSRAFDPANVATEFADALGALALALANGGGCGTCHGEYYQAPCSICDGPTMMRPASCPACAGTGIADDMRALLAQIGVLEVR